MSEITPRRILITGGAGFIGFHLAREIARTSEGSQIVLVDTVEPDRVDHELKDLLDHDRVEMMSGDLTAPETYLRLGKGYDEVYHLAAIRGVRNVIEKPHEVLRVNFGATALLLEWFAHGGGNKLLFASTSEVYAWTQEFHPLPIPTPEQVPLALTDLENPRISYAGSKIFSELAVTQCCKAYQKDFTIVRYHNVYGPRMGIVHVIPELYYRALQGQDPLVVYSADHSRAFCYVSDAVEATIRAMREPDANGRTINIGNHREETKVGQLARLILEKAGLDISIQPEPAPNDPIVRRCPDTSVARQLLGYEPRVTLGEGLDRTLSWYSSYFNQSNQ